MAFGAQAAQQVGQVGHAFCYQIADHAFALPAAFDGQQPGAEQHFALGFAYVAPDDDLGHAVFVFERHEDRSLGRGRLLAQGHYACGAHAPAVGNAPQLLPPFSNSARRL